MDKTGNKTGGREAGTPNRITQTVKPFLAEFVLGKLQPEEMHHFWDSLKPGERATLLPKLIAFLLPKQSNIEIEPTRITPEYAKNILNSLLAEDGSGEDS